MHKEGWKWWVLPYDCHCCVASIGKQDPQVQKHSRQHHNAEPPAGCKASVKNPLDSQDKKVAGFIAYYC